MAVLRRGDQFRLVEFRTARRRGAGAPPLITIPKTRAPKQQVMNKR